MSLITEQIKRLRSEAAGMILQNGTTARLLREAADTISVLSEKLQAANMERSTAYYHGGWIPVKEKAAEFPCLACDSLGNPPFIPMGVVTFKKGKGGIRCFESKDYKFNGYEEFMKGKEITLADGEKARILPLEIIAWMPLPEPYREDGE